MLRNKLRRLAASNAGQALFELAIVTPFLLFALVEIVDVGRYTYLDIEVASSARAGVQYGAQSSTTSNDSAGMAAAATSDAANIPSGLTVNPTPNYCQCDNGVNCAGTLPLCSGSHHALYYVKVISSATFHPLIAYPGISNLVVSRTAIAQVTE